MSLYSCCSQDVLSMHIPDLCAELMGEYGPINLYTLPSSGVHDASNVCKIFFKSELTGTGTCTVYS